MSSRQASADKLYTRLGRLSGLFGVRGWLKVYSDTQPREGILNYTQWQLECKDGLRTVTVETGHRHGKSVVVKLVGIDDRETAENLLQCEIGIEKSQLPETGPDDYYWAELIGLKVMTASGVDLGIVGTLMETGANDVLVVKGERERLIPYIPEQVILEIDLENGQMLVEWDPEF